MTEAVSKKSPDQVSDVPKRVTPILVNAGFTDEPVPSVVIHAGTKFYKGQWAHKSNENDPESIRLGVNGEILTFQRGVDTIVPAPYLDVAKHARYPKFKQEPGKGRKTIGYITRFPFNVIDEATYEEFKKMFTEGSKKTREMVAIHGLAIPVEEQVPQLE